MACCSAGARAPADPDLELAAVGLGGERDVGDQRAQQPLAITMRGARRGPQRGQVAGERLELLARGLAAGHDVLGELGLGVFEFAELLLPAVLEAAGDQAIVGLAGVESALGADRLIAGALDAQLRGAVRARATVGVLIGGSQRERDLLGRERLQQRRAISSSTTARLDRRQPGVLTWSAREWPHS